MRPVSFLLPILAAKLMVSPRYHIDDGVTSSFVMEIPLDGLAI